MKFENVQKQVIDYLEKLAEQYRLTSQHIDSLSCLAKAYERGNEDTYQLLEQSAFIMTVLRSSVDDIKITIETLFDAYQNHRDD